MTNPDGSGAVKTYISGSPATLSIDADVRLVHKPNPVIDNTTPPVTIHTNGFDIEDYVVVSGQPGAVPDCMVRMRSVSGVGPYIYSDVPPAPADVRMNSAARWLPTDASFSPDGLSWAASVGGGLVLTADIPPYLDDFYSFQVRGGDEVALPAVIFDGDSSMRLRSGGWSAASFTFIIVAVMHQNPESNIFGILESYVAPPDPSTSDGSPDVLAPTPPTPWGVRWRQGQIELWAGDVVLSHQSFSLQSRPIVIGISIDAAQGNLLVCDRNKSTRSFSTAGYQINDIDVLVGATSSGLLEETAYMDVLEFNYYDRALSFADLDNALHLLDSIYGVVG